MGNYHFHCLDRDGHSVRDEAFSAIDDLEAIELSRLRLEDVDCELRRGARVVARLSEQGDLSRPVPRRPRARCGAPAREGPAG